MPKRDPAASPSRRDLLRYGLGAAAATFLLPSFGRAHADEETRTVAGLPGRGRTKQVLFLYMIGGASQFETLDPKPGTATGGPTRGIATAVPGVQIADSLPQLAKRMDRVALIRSMSSKEGNHDRARYLMHTGYPPQPAVRHAGFGAIVSSEKGDPEADVPAYVTIGGPGEGAGYLGVHHAPFVVQDAARPLDNVELPRGLTADRRDARLDLLGRMNARFAREHGDAIPSAQAAMYERARRLMDSDHLQAFDVTKEKESVRASYGAGKLGTSCLLARRLLEIGVPFVEVMMGGWDTHDDNFNRVKALNAELDVALAALLDDLGASGRLDHTMVVWLGDFGRTPRITSSDGRGHYPQAWSMMLAGGGVQGGRVVGATDGKGESVTDRPVTPPDLYASICHAMDLDPTKTFHTSAGRPVTIVDPSGAPVRELFEA